MINLEDNRVGFAPAMRASLASGDVVLLQTNDGGPDESVLSDIKSRRFKAVSQQVAVFPVRSMADDTMGFVILGLNPLKPFNLEYRGFVDVLTKQIVSNVSSILLAEEIRRTKKDCATLFKEFISRTSAFEKNESRFMEFADRSPTAIVAVAPDCVVLYANEPWYSFTLVDPKKPEESMWWVKNVIPED